MKKLLLLLGLLIAGLNGFAQGVIVQGDSTKNVDMLGYYKFRYLTIPKISGSPNNPTSKYKWGLPGLLTYDSTNNRMYIAGMSGWNEIPLNTNYVAANYYSTTASSGQTVFTPGFNIPAPAASYQLFVNGVKISTGFTNNTTNITFASGKTAGDKVEIQLLGYGAGSAGIDPTPRRYTVSFEGNSLTADERLRYNAVGGGPYAGYLYPWPFWFQQRLEPDIRLFGYNNYATSGDITDPTGELGTSEINEVLTGKDTVMASGNFIFINSGINNIQSGQSATTTYDSVKRLHKIYQSKGYKTVAFTLTATRHASFSDGQTAAMWVQIQAYNAFLRTNYNTDIGATVLVDVQTDTNMAGYAAPLNQAWFRDQLHYWPEGAHRISNMAVQAVPWLIAGMPHVVGWDKMQVAPHTVPSTVLTFPNSLGGSTSDTYLSATTWKTTSTDNDFGHTRLSDKHIPAGTNGEIYMSGTSFAGMLGVSLTNAKVGFATGGFDAAIFIDNMNSVSAIHDGTGVSTTTAGLANLGDYRIKRTSAALTLEESTDGGTSYHSVYTFDTSGGHASLLTNDLYIVLDLLGSTSAAVVNPRGVGSL